MFGIRNACVVALWIQANAQEVVKPGVLRGIEGRDESEVQEASGFVSDWMITPTRSQGPEGFVSEGCIPRFSDCDQTSNCCGNTVCTEEHRGAGKQCHCPGIPIIGRTCSQDSDCCSDYYSNPPSRYNCIHGTCQRCYGRGTECLPSSTNCCSHSCDITSMDVMFENSHGYCL
ncbi:hypothetical protein ACHAWF_017872 [Thalassiosira exigua]